MNIHAEYIFRNGRTRMINSETYPHKTIEQDS